MKEIIVRIPEENSALATQLLEKLGDEIEEMKEPVGRPKDLKKVSVKKQVISKEISATYLFGKWKNLEIDAKKIRNEAWDRSRKYL